jgi:hypothetical protein
MDWDALTHFVGTEDPPFAASVQGVSREELDEVERARHIQLPRGYRRFLTMMGRDSDGFYLFGPHRNQKFDDLLAQVSPRLYPQQRYFKIAFAVEPSEISPSDYFLDLARSDGADAPIVMFQDDEDSGIDDFKPEYVRETPFTFTERATNRLFTFFVLDRAAHRSRVVIGAMSAANRRAANDNVVEILGKMNFEPVLPSSRVVGTFRRGRFGALVTVREDLRCVAIDLGGDGPSLKVVVDQLSLRFPDAAISGSGGRFGS